jgi:Flp pilus assembly protein CpaB
MFRKESRLAMALGPSVITSFEQIKGAYSSSFIAAGQPLLSEYITMKRPVNQIQATIPEGYRGVTLSVDTTTSVEGWARAGAKVDVVLASQVAGKAALTVIVQNARVLSAGRQTGGEPGAEQQGAPSTVTLLVTAEDAAKIQLASNSGQLSLSLRGDDDEANYPSATSINIDSVLGNDGIGTPSAVPSEGTIRIDGKEFEIIGGRLVPLDPIR